MPGNRLWLSDIVVRFARENARQATQFGQEREDMAAKVSAQSPDRNAFFAMPSSELLGQGFVSQPSAKDIS